MQYKEVAPDELPMELLLEADPSESHVRSYLADSWCFMASDPSGKVIAVCVVGMIGEHTAELFNIAVNPESQGRGVGTGLLKYVIDNMSARSIERIELGTGTFGYQLTFYQRVGFRVGSVLKDHFLDNYPDPIFEDEIQLKDMLRLYLEL